MFKFTSLLFLISVFLFGTSCESIKKKSVQSEEAPASRSLAGLTKPSAGISRTQINQLKRREREILSEIKGEPLKVVYSFLVNEKTKRICYVESFKTRDIIPHFAKPASYEEARSLKKPPVPKCSGQEYSMMSSYQNASVLSDRKGVQVAGLPIPLVIGGVAGLGGLSVCSINDSVDFNLVAGIFISSPFFIAFLAEKVASYIVFSFVVGCVAGAGGMYIYHTAVGTEGSRQRTKK